MNELTFLHLQVSSNELLLFSKLHLQVSSNELLLLSKHINLSSLLTDESDADRCGRLFLLK